MRRDLQITPSPCPNHVRVTQTSIQGKTNTMELPTTEERIQRWNNSRLPIQSALPELNADQREFLLSGLLPEEWDAVVEGVERDPAKADDWVKSRTLPDDKDGEPRFFIIGGGSL